MSKREEPDIALREDVKGGRGRKAGAIYFPRNSLEEALRVPRAIWENNAGNPFAIGDLAQKLGISPTSSQLQILLRSSQRYGLTEGSWQADITKKISLKPLGSSVAAPKAGEDVNASKRKALETPEVFQRVLASLSGKIIPPPDVFKNTLIKDYHLSKGDAEACYDVLKKNIDELGVSQDIDGKLYLRLDKLGESLAEIPTTTVMGEEGPIAREEVFPTEAVAPKVFISHSKNEKILDQIKTILDFGQFKNVVAEEVETTSIPIPDKVFSLMRECNCAIINISADEKEKNPDGSYRVNANVLIEIGGAFLKYDKKVILLTDKRVVLPSNLQGLYRCEYEGDELSFTTALKLQKALARFRET